MADAYGSGPYESNFMQVQVLLSAPKYGYTLLGVPVFLFKGMTGLEGSGVNDCQWQSEPTTAPPAGGQVLLSAPRQSKGKLCSDFFIQKSHPPASLLLLFPKSHARLACSVVNVLTTTRCRFRLFVSLMCGYTLLVYPCFYY